MKKKKILKIGKFTSFQKSSEIFIGEWCSDNYLSLSSNYFFNDKSYSRDSILKSHKKFLLYYDELENYVFEQLNSFHKKKYPDRYWRILLGNWLNWYIKIIINRFQIMDKIINSKKYNLIEFSFKKETQLCSQGTSDINLLCDDPNWNSKLYLNLFRYFKVKKKINIKYIKEKNTNKIYTLQNNYLNITLNFLSKIFSKEKDIFFIETYLPKLVLFKSQLKLFQFPTFWRRQPFCFKKINQKLRNKAKKKIFFKHDRLKTFLFSKIFDFMPICILEGYKENLKLSKLLPYPKKTKLIITASNFNSDELFKIWTAEKVLGVTKYAIMQHGGGYENFRFHIEKPCEILTPHIFFTWGWGFESQQYNKKHIYKIFVTRILNRKKYNYLIKKTRKITLFLPDRFPYRYSWNTFREYLENLKEIKNFIKSLNKNSQSNMYLKLLKRQREDNSEELNRDISFWKSFDNKINFVNDNDNIKKIYRETKLSIFFYNSTGVLELISLNKPIVLILNPNQWLNIPKKVVNDYQDLYKAGIIYKDIKSAALKINKISKNPNSWWFNKKRQKALLKFRKKFSNYTNNLENQFVKEIKKIQKVKYI